MLVDDYCVTRPMWPLATCISSVVVAHQAPQLGVLQSSLDSPPIVPHLLQRPLVHVKSASTSLFPPLPRVQVGLACVAHVTTEPGYTSHKTTQVQGLQAQRHKVTLRDGIPSTDERMVMVQEDQAGELWSLYVGLYT